MHGQNHIKEKRCLHNRTQDGKNSTCVPNTHNCGYCMFGNTKAKYSRMVTDGDSEYNAVGN